MHSDTDRGRFVGYRGNVNTWECDENGHMNVRYYVDKAVQAMTAAVAAAGLTRTALDDEFLVLKVGSLHMRFHAETHAGAPLTGHVTLADMNPEAPRILVEITDPSGDTVHATFLARLALRREPDLAPTPFPEPVLAALLGGGVVPVPDHARPRSVPPTPPYADWSLDQTTQWPMHEISTGIVLPSECDRDGRLSLREMIGRVSDGIAHLISIQRGSEAMAARIAGDRGGAVIEYGTHVIRHPRAGDRFTLRSGLAGARGKTVHYVHLMFDADTSELVLAARATAVTLDLKARKAVAMTAEELERLAPMLIGDDRLWPGASD